MPVDLVEQPVGIGMVHGSCSLVAHPFGWLFGLLWLVGLSFHAFVQFVVEELMEWCCQVCSADLVVDDEEPLEEGLVEGAPLHLQ